MNHRTLAALLAAALVALTGCAQMETAWEDTKNYYYENLSPDPELDLDEVHGDEEERKLARLFAPVDARLEALDRFMSAHDSYPDQQWVDRLSADFPWVSGMAAVDTRGEVLMKEPESSLKPFDPSPLLALGEVWKERGLRAVAVPTDLGAEVYVGSPFFQDNEWRGLTVVHFDMRNVLQYSPSREELIVFTPKEVLWTGKYDARQLGLLERDWNATLREDVRGEFGGPDGDYLWITRYLGDMNIVYAASVAEGGSQ